MKQASLGRALWAVVGVVLLALLIFVAPGVLARIRGGDAATASPAMATATAGVAARGDESPAQTAVPAGQVTLIAEATGLSTVLAGAPETKPALAPSASTPSGSPTPAPSHLSTATAAPTVTPTLMPIVLRLPTATPSPVVLQIPPTPQPTAPPTSRPAAQPAATARATATPRPAATPTAPAPVSVNAPLVVEPARSQTVSGVVTFRWQPNGPLPPGTGYEVVWWNTDESPAASRGIAPPTTDTQLAANVDPLAQSGQFRGTLIYWTVLVVQIDPYVRLVNPDAADRGDFFYGGP